MTEHDARRKALRHLIELETSGHSEEAWSGFEAWLREDPAHRIEFAKLEKAWRTVGHLQTMLQGRDPAFDRPDSSSLARLSGREGPSWRQRWWSIGAVVFVLSTVIAAAYHYSRQFERRTAYETGLFGTRTIPLEADPTIARGRSAWIEITSTWLYRELRLGRSEVTFDATLHWPRSFLVYAGGSAFQDIGARFDMIGLGESHVEPVVEQGTLVMSTPSAAVSPARLPSAMTELIIGAGQSVIVKSGEILRQRLTAAELDRRFAWTQGMLVVDGTLADAVVEFNRYNTRQLVVFDRALLSTRVGGRYKATDPDSFAKYLRDTHGIASKRIRQGDLGKDLILIGVHP